MIRLINNRMKYVASFAEAWIEIILHESRDKCFESPPSRRRGLKFFQKHLLMLFSYVASFAEAWIEIMIYLLTQSFREGRLLRGGVD